MQEDHSKSINRTLWILNAAMVACCIIDLICCLAMERHYIFSSLTFGHISSLEEYRALPDAFTRFAGTWYSDAPFTLCGILVSAVQGDAPPADHRDPGKHAGLRAVYVASLTGRDAADWWIPRQVPKLM